MDFTTVKNTEENHSKKENDHDGMSAVEIALITIVVVLSSIIAAAVVRYFRLRKGRPVSRQTQGKLQSIWNSNEISQITRNTMNIKKIVLHFGYVFFKLLQIMKWYLLNRHLHV